MRELSPEAAALIRAGRTALRPQVADRDRVLQSLTRALGETAVGGDVAPAGAVKSAGAQLAVKGWLLGGLSLVGLGAALAFLSAVSAGRPAPAPRAPADRPGLSSGPVESTPASTPSSGDHASGSMQVQPSANAAPPIPLSTAHAPVDSLPAEVRLLSRAEQQLNAGFAEDALKTLAEHERRFPNGALAEERLAARVQALCALGRSAEARKDLARLGRAYPQSPHLERARRSCSMGTGSGP
jgi:hypothetical protein